MNGRMILAAALVALVGACAQLGGHSETAAPAASEPWAQTQSNLPDGGPPIDADGLYDSMGSCPGEACEVAHWQYFDAPKELRASPNRTAPVIITLAANEWVSVRDMVHRWRPVRGVVVGDVQGADQDETRRLSIGDVVYTIDYEGEGFISLWRRGDLFSWYDPGEEGPVVDGIRWDAFDEAQRAADNAAGGGWWIQLQRENGQTGWVQELNCYAGWDPGDKCGERNPGPVAYVQPECAPTDISEACRAQRASADPAPRLLLRPRPFRDCRDECPSMVRIPGHSFALSQTEVTLAEWAACVRASACEARADESMNASTLPVTNVSWNDAQAYVRWISQRTGHRYRLPTTDEWVAAAFPRGRRQNYYWGNDRPTCERGARNGVSFDACGEGGPLPVGSFQPNAYRLYDMIGNVGEWLDEPYGDERGDDFKALIGSSWASNEESLGGRGGAFSEENGPDTGIRVARDR